MKQFLFLVLFFVTSSSILAQATATITGPSYCLDGDVITAYIDNGPSPSSNTTEYEYTISLQDEGINISDAHRFKIVVEGGLISTFTSNGRPWQNFGAPTDKLYLNSLGEMLPGYQTGLISTSETEVKIKVRWGENEDCMNIKCDIATAKLKFPGTKKKLFGIIKLDKIDITSIGPSAKIDVLKVAEISSISQKRTSSCNSVVYKAEIEEAPCGSCGAAPIYVWYRNGLESQYSLSDEYSIPASSANGIISVELRYGQYSSARVSKNISIQADVLAGPNVVYAAGESFYLRPGTLGDGDVTNVEWSCSSGSVPIYPNGLECFVQPTNGGGQSTLFVSFTNACGVQKTLQKTFEIDEEAGGCEGCPQRVRNVSRDFNSSYESNEVKLHGSKAIVQQDFVSTSMINYSLSFQSPVESGSDLLFQFSSADKNRELVITSSIGQEVSRTLVRNGEVNIRMETYQLVSGLYFISLLEKGMPTQTKSLVIK